MDNLQQVKEFTQLTIKRYFLYFQIKFSALVITYTHMMTYTPEY